MSSSAAAIQARGMNQVANYVQRKPLIAIASSVVESCAAVKILGAIVGESCVLYYLEGKYRAKKWFQWEKFTVSGGQLSQGVGYEGFYCRWFVGCPYVVIVNQSGVCVCLGEADRHAGAGLT